MVTEADKKKWADNKKVALAFRFEIEINGLVEAGFNEVSGLQVETEFEEYNEGGLNEYTTVFQNESNILLLFLKEVLFNPIPYGIGIKDLP